MKHTKVISFENTAFYKKKTHKICSNENLYFPTEKNWTASVFVLE